MKKSFLIKLLRITTILMFLGRAWEHIYWEGPYRNIFYNPHGFGKVLEKLSGRTLQEIYNDHFYEHLIDNISIGIGVVFLLAAVSTLFYSSDRPYLKWVIITGVVGLGLTFYGYFVNKHHLYGMLLEHSAQFVTPLLFLWAFTESNSKKIVLVAKVAIALTFVCHGLFAIGYYPQPGRFADMMIIGFGIEEDIARRALVHIGWLDFIFAIAVLIPYKMIMNKGRVILPLYYLVLGFIGYGVIWGFLTAFARIYIHFDAHFIWASIEGFLYEVLVRLPHGVLPLLLWSEYRKQRAVT